MFSTLAVMDIKIIYGNNRAETPIIIFSFQVVLFQLRNYPEHKDKNYEKPVRDRCFTLDTNVRMSNCMFRNGNHSLSCAFIVHVKALPLLPTHTVPWCISNPLCIIVCSLLFICDLLKVSYGDYELFECRKGLWRKHLFDLS